MRAWWVAAALALFWAAFRVTRSSVARLLDSGPERWGR